MSNISQTNLERLQSDLMKRGMTEKEAHYRAKAFLKKVNRND